MLVKTYAAAVNGLEVTTVTCEVSMSRGVQFHLTGLADTAVKESYDRIKAALSNNGLKMPTMDITVNLSPADIKKEGSAYDLPLAIGILAANGTLDTDTYKFINTHTLNAFTDSIPFYYLRLLDLEDISII